jgi:cytochrome c biogenesis protein
MTTTHKNSFVSLFASVQLALFLIFLMAATSIIGTFIPQNKPPAFYVEAYGVKTARLLQILDIPDMYNSWWFLALLGVFALNLIVCSLDRIPQVIRIIRRDNLTASREQLGKLPLHALVTTALPAEEALLRVRQLFTTHGWKVQEREREDGRLLFAEKGAWTRFGVYVVHVSILVILAGAIIGSAAVARKILKNPDFAFKGSVMIPEGETTDHIFSTTSERINLGFTLRCDLFTIDYWANGMPKTYLSKVTIIEDGKAVLATDITVNNPLIYKGVTFYQSSYQPFQQYQAALGKQGSDLRLQEIIPPASQRHWQEGGVSFGIINRETQGEVTRRVKVWFTDHQGEPSTFWVAIGQEASVERPSGIYSLTIRQMYATGLQAAKDPGVWLVYLGCALMLLGLYIAFFMSHRKLYAFIPATGTAPEVDFAGSANKNTVGFSRVFSEIINKFEK